MIDNRLSGGSLVEVPTATCCHCQVQVVLNPLRTRERNHCRKCHAYVCDNPTCVAECNGGLSNVFEEMREAIAKRGITF